jgi:hypothetical protein
MGTTAAADGSGEVQMSLSLAEQRVIEELERQFFTPQDRTLSFLRRWADVIIGLITLTAVAVGLIILSAVN